MCETCGEVVYQCRRCRGINYEAVGSFFCVDCGYCAHGSFFYTANSKISTNATAIVSPKDDVRVKGLLKDAKGEASEGSERSELPHIVLYDERNPLLVASLLA